MWKVTRRGLAANKLRFVLTAVAVVLGVAFVSGTLVLTATIGKTFDDLFTNIYKNTDAVVRAQQRLSSDFGTGERPNVPQSLLDAVRQAPGVAQAEGDVQIAYAQVVGKDGKAVGNPGNGPPTLGFGYHPSSQLSVFHLVEGRGPTSDDEVAIDRNTADAAKLSVGDPVRILTTAAPKTYHLTGIVKFGDANSLVGASATLFTIPRAQELANAPGQYSQISVKAAPGVSQTQLQNNIQKSLASQELGQYQVLTGKQITKENQDALQKQLSFFNVALLIFALISLVVGSVIIYNTFSIVVAQRTREMALLRAIGASQRQVMGQVFGESVVIGLLASAVGVASGVLLAIGLKAAMSAIGFDLPSTGVVVRPVAIIAGLLVGFVVTVLSAVVPARQAARVPPVAALRDVAIERPPRRGVRLAIGGGGMLIGIGLLFFGLFANPGNAIAYVGLGAALVFVGAFVLGPLFARALSLVIAAPLPKIKGMTGTLARQNAARNPKRTATTATALLIGVALVGFITIFAASAKATISSAVDQQLGTDFIVQGPGNFAPGIGLSPKLAEQIAALPEVDASTGLRVGDVGINNSRTTVNSVDPVAGAKLFNLGDVAGSLRSLTPDGIGVSKRKADDHHWKLGDTIPVTFVKTGVQTLKVQFIYSKNTFGDYYISLASYEKNFTDQLDSSVFVNLKPGVSPDQGRQAIESVTKSYPNAKVFDDAQFKADREKQINGFVALVYLLLFLALFIALIGIANTLALSITERTRELGLLRAVGMSRSQVRSAIRWESVIISLLGTINGLAIGLLFGWSVVRALKDQGFNSFAIAPGQLLVVVIILAVASVGAAIFPARRAAKLDVLRAISTE
ncbi:MAG TPA: FtsX-like permease family protein [Acidimicrobiia bacterium]|nr:FtsX-like permease family protein [Acidimicrobiia bacterium]